MRGLIAAVVCAACGSARTAEPPVSTVVKDSDRTIAPVDAAVDASTMPDALTGEPTAAQFDAAPNILTAEHSHGCTVKWVDGYLQIRCPITGDGDRLLDTGNTDVGRLEYTSEHVTWILERDRMHAFGWVFQDGLY